MERRRASTIAYSLVCDRAWRTRAGSVHGWIGAETISFQIEHVEDGRWLLNGVVVRNLDDCIDLDFGFTPATNLFQLRRIALAVGADAAVPVAWLDLMTGTLMNPLVAARERSYLLSVP
jgi:hypothetical protein